MNIWSVFVAFLENKNFDESMLNFLYYVFFNITKMNVNIASLGNLGNNVIDSLGFLGSLRFLGFIGFLEFFRNLWYLSLLKMIDIGTLLSISLHCGT